MVIYTVSYPPRLIPIALVLPNSAISTSVDGATGPAAPGASALSTATSGAYFGSVAAAKNASTHTGAPFPLLH